jgi:hypothetical protein
LATQSLNDHYDQSRNHNHPSPHHHTTNHITTRHHARPHKDNVFVPTHSFISPQNHESFPHSFSLRKQKAVFFWGYAFGEPWGRKSFSASKVTSGGTAGGGGGVMVMVMVVPWWTKEKTYYAGQPNELRNFTRGVYCKFVYYSKFVIIASPRKSVDCRSLCAL